MTVPTFLSTTTPRVFARPIVPFTELEYSRRDLIGEVSGQE